MNFKNFIYFNFISGHPPQLVDESFALDKRGSSPMSARSLGQWEGTAIPAKQLCLLAHYMACIIAPA